jgi:hypothetical protein
MSIVHKAVGIFACAAARTPGAAAEHQDMHKCNPCSWRGSGWTLDLVTFSMEPCENLGARAMNRCQWFALCGKIKIQA